MLKILLLSLSRQYTVDGQYIPSLFIEPEVRHDKTSYINISVVGNNFDLFIMSGSRWSCVEYYVIGGRDSYQAVDDFEE